MPIVRNLNRKLKAHLKRRHKGKEQATPSRNLEARFGVSGSTIRRAVLELRRTGEPICSDNSGYYYAEDACEIWQTIDRMERRMAGSRVVVAGLRKAAVHVPTAGQMQLEPLEVTL